MLPIDEGPVPSSPEAFPYSSSRPFFQTQLVDALLHNRPEQRRLQQAGELTIGRLEIDQQFA